MGAETVHDKAQPAVGAGAEPQVPAAEAEPLAMPRGYRRSRAVARFLARVLFSWQVSGSDSIPARGGFILASNHASYVDPPLIGAAATRRLCYMAKRELFGVPVLGWVITALGATPVRRGSVDRQVLRVAAAFLKAGGGVLIFPAGTRRRDAARDPKPGVSLLAAECQVPVVPTRIEGSTRLWRALFRRRSLKIYFGEPVPPPPLGGGHQHRALLREHTARIMRVIESLGSTVDPGAADRS